MPSLRRLLLPVLLATAPLAASVAAAPPASASVTGSTSTGDVVLYSHCQQHPISYDVAAAPGTLLWRLEIQVADPSGHTSEGTVLNSTTNPPTSGTVSVTFCGSEEPGTYTVRSTGFYEVVPAVQLPFTLPETTFEVRPVATRTSLAATSLGHGRYRLAARVLEQAERGFQRSNGVRVRVQRFAHGSWHELRGRTLSTVHGRATTTYAGRPGTKLRAVVRPKSNYAGSTSDPVVL